MAEDQECEIMWKRGRTLGQGGFGFVSLASTTHNSPLIPPLIAVKSCRLSHSQSLEDETEFLRMCQESPHVIRSFGVKVTQEDGILLYNLLLEYASAGSLADRLLNNDQLGLPLLQVQKHTKNVLLGLRFIHRKGIIHCDIKPHNILLTSTDDDDDDTEEVAKIADFGLSLTLEQSWTQKQGMRGTQRYMAPESLLKQEYGPEADIWALGCTVYELITGTPLWESSNSDPNFDDVWDRIKYEEPNLENDKLSTEAKDFLRYCLIKNPKSRWSARLLLNHSFLKSADSVLPPKKRKRQHGYRSSLQRPNQKRAFRTQPHIRHLVIEQ